MAQKIDMSIRIFLLCLVLAVFAIPLPALEETIGFTVTGGSRNNVDETLVTMQVQHDGQVSRVVSALADGIQVAPGYRGKPEIQLREGEYRQTNNTDLLLHFNESPSIEAGPNYFVSTQGMSINSQIRRMGASAGLFNKDIHGLVLEAGKNSLFEPGQFWQDFSIEFWLYPSTMNEGEQIIAWEGSTWIDGKQAPQLIKVELRDRKLVWDFTNVFIRFAPGKAARMAMETSRFTLKNRREILPRVWQHHMLRFDSNRCLLEYTINGTPEDMVTTKTNRSESGEPYRPWLGETSRPRISIGAGFTGFLDELRISRSRVPLPQIDSFADQPGWVIFNPIDFREIGVGSKVLNVNAEWTHPGTSEIAFYYKMAMMPGIVQRNDIGWIRFQPGKLITDKNQGQFLYFKIELLPDGNSMQGPALQGLSITYRPDPPPPAPGGIIAIPEDGAVTLRWNPVPVNDLQGYLVYWGLKPGQYFGEKSSAGPSPITVKSDHEIRISGLENGKIYYFAVASFDQSNNPIYGIHLKRSVSREVSARPAR